MDTNQSVLRVLHEHERITMDFSKAEPAIGVIGRSGKRFWADVAGSVAAGLGGERYIPVLVSVGPGIIHRATLVPRKGGQNRVYVDPMAFDILGLKEGDHVALQFTVDEEMVEAKTRRKSRKPSSRE
jgi:hypothetical protein